MTRHSPRCLALALLLPGLLLSSPALAGDEVVLVVPYAQSNPTLPHPVHERAPITLKAMIRGASCSYYRVRWDTDRDGDFADEVEKRYSRDSYTRSVRDIGRTFEVPSVDHETLMNINVRAISECDGSEHYGTYRLYVHNWYPTNDPRLWTNDQVEVLGAIALDEVLWYLHRKITSLRGDETDAWLRGRPARSEVGALQIWLNAINDHQPAFPPGLVTGTEANPLPEGWQTANERRWRSDPYAEDSVRLLNDLLSQKSVITYNIDDADEAGTCGYDLATGAVVNCPRLPNTTDGRGLHIGTTNEGQHTYRTGITLGGLAPILPSLAGVALPAGRSTVRGRPFEWVIQQMTDYLGAMQIDSGCARGGWYYYGIGNGNCSASDASAVQWAHIGLESAEVAGAAYGVVVNNRHKYRLVDNFVNNQAGDGGSRYRTSYSNGSTYQLTGGALVGGRWLGVQHFDANDNTIAFPDESDLTRGKLRQVYDRYLAYTLTEWGSSHRRGNVGWQDGFWRDGDPYCGDTDRVFDVGDQCGNTYALYSFQKGFRTGTPELNTVGVHDWYREFATYYVRAQRRAISANDPWWNYSSYGEIWDDYCERTSVTCNYNRSSLTPMMAGLVLTPTIFNAKPFALAEATPAVVTEGCIGGSAGRVSFEHHRSFHPNDDAQLVSYEWDVDASNGLWWETNAAPDFQESPNADGVITGNFQHIYRQAGEYTATLRVVDNLGQWRSSRLVVRVETAENVAPSVTVGGPYYVEIGAPVQLDAIVDDINVDCGDHVSVRWDIDGDGAFDDAEGENPLVPFDVLADLPVQVPQTIRLQATDSEGAVSETTATLVVFPREPVAVAHAFPNPAACGQTVTFDGTGSRHPDPRRHIAQFGWDVDGAAGDDGGGAVFRRSFNRFGSWPVTLRVLDDLGREDTDGLTLSVVLGNRRPVARTTARVVVGDDRDLILDASASYDPDDACGDRVVTWRWDVNHDGDFADPIDAVGPRPTLTQGALAALVGGHGTATVVLEVEDTQGATGQQTVQITVVETAPVPVVVQTPNPATVHEAVGHVEARLDARASHSPLPGVSIVGVDWDLDLDGVFETRNQPVLDYERMLPTPVDVFSMPEMTVGVRVTDSEGRQTRSQVTLDVRVGPAPPTADPDPHTVPSNDPAETGYHALAGEPLVLDASDSMDPNGDPMVVVRWDLNHQADEGFETDVLLTGDTPDAPAPLVTTVDAETLAEHGMSEPGTYEVALQITDDNGLTGQGVTTITVYPRDPVAVVEAEADHVSPGTTLHFDATGSDHAHPDVDIVAVRWDLDGDGSFDDAEGPLAEHTFDQFTFDGPIVVAVQVEDSAGHTATAEWPVFVDDGNRPPEGVAGGHRDDDGQVDGPYVIVQGEPLVLSAEGSVEPDASAGDAITTYRWDLDGDGDFEIVTDQPVPDPVPWPALVAEGLSQPGAYTVTLTVEDQWGAQSETPATVHVVRGPEAHIAAPSRAHCGEAVTLDGSGSTTDGPTSRGFRLVDWAWDLDGDGVYDDASGPRVQFPAVDSAIDGELALHIALRVTDELGHTAIAERVIEIDVQNQAPTADAGGPYSTGPLGDGFVPVLLDARGSRDPDAPCDAVVSYRWDIDGDGAYGAADGEPEGALVTLEDPTWRPDTARTVGLIVCDALGACSDPTTALIEVLRTAPPAGAVATPTPDDCVGNGDFSVTLDVSDPEGDRLNIEVRIANRLVAVSSDVPTRADGQAVRVALPVDLALIPEGQHDIVVQITDAEGGYTTVRSPGRVTFDRTPPTIEIGRELGADVCYQQAHVPRPQVEVVDAMDRAPQVREVLTSDACARTLAVTATDACGNVAEDSRAYLIAEAPNLIIDGPDDGSRVATARYTWAIDGNPSCVSAITGTVVVNGGAPQPYPEGSPLSEPGVSVLTVRVANCMGIFREHVRWVRINYPPEAVAVPPGQGVFGDLLGARYVVAEGSPLTLDGSASRAPEADDTVLAWLWDFDGDGRFDDAVGARVAFNTADDGLFDVGLRVSDDLGATGDGTVRVRVNDVSPRPDAGGPYTGTQGRVVTFDGSASEPGSWADPLSNFRWDFGDGVVDSGGALTRPTHRFEHDGWYDVTLTVSDEDNSAEDRVTIFIEDVDPIIHRVNLPEDPRELATLTLSVEASPGAPADPITRYEWDFDGDGQFDYGSADSTVAITQYRDAGAYALRVRVRDPDSYAEAVVELNVRECTFAEVIEWVGEQVADAREAGVLTPFQTFQLNHFDRNVTKGLWGERWDRRGNTLVAVELMVMQLRAAIATEADLGLPLWALSRQQYREIQRTHDALLASDRSPGAGHASIQRAQGWIRTMGGLFEGEGFWRACFDPMGQGIAQEVWYAGFEAYFWLMDSVDHCAQDFNGFRLPDVADPVARSQEANTVNSNLGDALRWLDRELDLYQATGAAGDDWGPGTEEMAQAIASLNELVRLATFRVGSQCNEAVDRCVTDAEALDLLLEGVSLVRQLSLARANGVYTRNWQSCVMLGVKFRTELSILRTEYACGPYTWTSQRVRRLQGIGLDLVAQGRISEALDFYGDPEMQCVMRETYNQCLVTRFPNANRWRDYPAYCLDYLEAEAEDPNAPEPAAP